MRIHKPQLRAWIGAVVQGLWKRQRPQTPQSETPSRWKMRDVSGLHYSSMNLGLTQRDLLRFIRLYSGGSLRQALGRDRQFWERVERRANRLYAAEQRRSPDSEIAAAQTLHSAGTQP